MFKCLMLFGISNILCKTHSHFQKLQHKQDQKQDPQKDIFLAFVQITQIQKKPQTSHNSILQNHMYLF